jgi:hypothetical protein
MRQKQQKQQKQQKNNKNKENTKMVIPSHRLTQSTINSMKNEIEMEK